jgi:ABC-type polysaccharide/polyol phosphate transport system ATPase subunit
MTPAIVFDRVWKKFRRGERHDSLRDLLPATARRLFRRHTDSELEDQEFWALKDVSFEVGPGEALGIIGPNGAGKSTVLKLLTRILRPTLGTCRVRGRVGALIEIAAGFHADLTGRENIYLQGAILGMGRSEIGRKLDEIVAFSGIEDFIDTPVKRYSSGMNARLGFSIAAHVDPEVLLIDEVLAVGDWTFQQKCFERLADFRKSGVAVAFVSHNMQAVMSLCDRALLLRRGRPPVLGPVSDVLAANSATAGEGSDHTITVARASLTHAGGSEPLSAPVPPTTRLAFELELVPHIELARCCMQWVVRRADGQVIFNGSSAFDGAAPVDVPAESLMHSRIEFDANVLKGTYFISGHLFDDKRVWPHVYLGTLASFVVHETTRAEGSAELSPRFAITVVNRDRMSAPPSVSVH